MNNRSPKYSFSESAKLTGALITGKFIAMIITFALPLFLTRFLSKDDYGLFSQFYLIITFIAFFFSFSFQSNLFYLYPVADNKSRKSLVIHTFLLLSLFSVIAILFLTLPLFRKELIGDTILINHYRLIIFGVILVTPSYIVEPLFVVRKDFLAGIIFPPADVLVRLILVILFVMFRPGINSIFIGIICSAAITYSFALLYSLTELKGSFSLKEIFDINVIKDQIVFVLPFGVAMSLDILAERFDRIISIKFLSASDFAVYSIAFFGIPGIMQVYDSFTKVKVIEMTINFREKRFDKISDIYKSLALKAFSFSIPVLAIVFLYAKKIILVLFTDKYIDSVPFFRIYMLSFIFFMFGPGLILRATGRTFETLKSYFFSCILTLPLTFILIRSYGMWGALISALLNLMLPRILMIRYELRYLNTNLAHHYPWREILSVVLISTFVIIPFVAIEVIFSPGIILSFFFSLIYLSVVAFVELKFNVFLLPRELVTAKLASLKLSH